MARYKYGPRAPSLASPAAAIAAAGATAATAPVFNETLRKMMKNIHSSRWHDVCS